MGKPSLLEGQAGTQWDQVPCSLLWARCLTVCVPEVSRARKKQNNQTKHTAAFTLSPRTLSSWVPDSLNSGPLQHILPDTPGVVLCPGFIE